MNLGTCNYVNGNGERCHNTGVVKVALAKRGGRNACFCERHARLGRGTLEGYTQENSQRRGCSSYKTPMTYSIELETHGDCNDDTAGSSLKGKMELVDVGFIPTSDGTVDVEYKSPIYEGLKAPSHACRTIERLINSADLSIDECCGTHFHCGAKDTTDPDTGEVIAPGINHETMEWVRRFYHSLFVPLSQEMLENPRATTTIFGRDFRRSDWARPIDTRTNPMEHTNFVNTQHDYTIEFRLCKFVSAKQYQRLMKLCSSITEVVLKTFIRHFDDDMPERKLYIKSLHGGAADSTWQNATEYRKKIAHDAAMKIVKLYDKAVDEL